MAYGQQIEPAFIVGTVTEAPSIGDHVHVGISHLGSLECHLVIEIHVLVVELRDLRGIVDVENIDLERFGRVFSRDIANADEGVVLSDHGTVRTEMQLTGLLGEGEEIFTDIDAENLVKVR